jgi:hypothetical protein
MGTTDNPNVLIHTTPSPSHAANFELRKDSNTKMAASNRLVNINLQIFDSRINSSAARR